MISADVIRIFVSVFVIILFLKQTYSQTAETCGSAIPYPEEKNEIEIEYEKTHDLMRILDLNLVLILRTTPPFGHPSNGGEFTKRFY